MLLTIKGVVSQGHRIASGLAANNPYPAGSLALQIPHFRERGLDLTHLHAATVNIDISPCTWKFVKPDYTFQKVAWSDLIPPETFSFVKAWIRIGQTKYPGWIYYPHPETKPGHMQAPGIIEFITVYISRLDYGSQVSIQVDENQVAIH